MDFSSDNESASKYQSFSSKEQSESRTTVLTPAPIKDNNPHFFGNSASSNKTSASPKPYDAPTSGGGFFAQLKKKQKRQNKKKSGSKKSQSSQQKSS